MPRDERPLKNLAVRRSEAGFIGALAALHAQHLSGAFPFELTRDLEPQLDPEVQRVVDVLRKSLSLTAPLRHFGERSSDNFVPDAEPFSVVETHGSFANGAGTMTSYSVWQLDVRGPVRLQAVVEAESEWGPNTWSTLLRAPQGTPLEPLVDAFKEQGVWLRTEVWKGL